RFFPRWLSDPVATARGSVTGNLRTIKEAEMEIKKVGVLGCGLMGSGIAQTAAMAGFQTIVREVSEDLIQKGFAAIEKSLTKFAEKGTITAEQQKQIRDRLHGTTSFDDLTECDLIIEAIIENLDEK